MFNSLASHTFNQIYISSEKAGSCLPDVVFDSTHINKMAELVKSIQPKVHKLKFNIKDSLDQSYEGILFYIIGENVQQRIEDIKTMLNTF